MSSDGRSIEIDVERALVKAVRNATANGHSPGEVMLSMMGGLAYSLGCTLTANGTPASAIAEIRKALDDHVERQFALGVERGAEGGQIV